MNSTIKKYLFGCSSIILIFVIWQLVAVYQNNDYVFPKVLEIFKNIIENEEIKANAKNNKNI